MKTTSTDNDLSGKLPMEKVPLSLVILPVMTFPSSLIVTDAYESGSLFLLSITFPATFPCAENPAGGVDVWACEVAICANKQIMIAFNLMIVKLIDDDLCDKCINNYRTMQNKVLFFLFNYCLHSSVRFLCFVTDFYKKKSLIFQ